MKHIYLFLLFLVVQHAVAQTKVRQDSLVIGTSASAIKISYFGDNLGVKPGFSIGVQNPFRLVNIEKTKKSGKIKEKELEFFYSYNLAYYQHKGYNSAFYLYPELGCRKLKQSGFYSEISVGTGWFHSFLSGATYTVDDYGTVKKVPAAGSSYWAFHVSPGLGWDFSKQNPHLPMQFFIKPNLLFQYPYNGLYLKHLYVESGICYSFSDFLSHHTEVIYKKK